MTCARASLSPSLRPNLSEFALIVEREREMLENPTPTLQAADTTIKRYAPPNQRNRPQNRRKSADRFERPSNLYGNDLEKNQVAVSRNFSTIDHGDSVSGNLLNETPRSGLITLEGCCSSEASRLLNERWAAALHHYNNPSTDLSVFICQRDQLCTREVLYPHRVVNLDFHIR
ncbi:uncharacterized protein LOC122293007 isoform X2 [Carya illinoinensis]|uniref:uncharacterized protein LOC122293007 isoform X2 n=1 Tax=Carya illinoinensis TaxID=32201 RepID=UPI001C7240E8|nr:uncharacterized protein LOC122293007 isoform X2 [Carya illinoinensis]